MKKTLKKMMCGLLAGATAFSLSTGLMGCNRDTGNEAQASVLRVSTANFLWAAPVFAADTMGYFEKYVSVPVEVWAGVGTPAAHNRLVGNSPEADVTVVGVTAAINSQRVEGAGNQAVIIGELTQQDSGVLIGRNPVSEWDWNMLAGKVVLSNQITNTPGLQLREAIEYHTDLRIVDIGSQPEPSEPRDMGHVYFRTTPFAQTGTGGMIDVFNAVGSTADFIRLTEPDGSALVLDGNGYIVTRVGDWNDPIPFISIATRESFIPNNSEILEEFMYALQRARYTVMNAPMAEVAEALRPQFRTALTLEYEGDDAARDARTIAIISSVLTQYRSMVGGEGLWATSPVMTSVAFYQVQNQIRYTFDGVLRPRLVTFAEGTRMDMATRVAARLAS